ncbi:MAG TPA: UDP-N-acetylglucosamine 2-epimerase (non-hydrolyzing) [Ohtaekwangia sp.]|nr:UDP-N-acetylglucosamine 2-epimerase (non-hydrolyzing) [Ohtaekwangia sp.]
MKIVTILGARPQFIKAAALSRAIASRSDVQEVIVHTGQHYDDNMSDVFFRQMDIPLPDYQLNVASSFHGDMTGRMMMGIEPVLLKEKPDGVVVYGDTNSTLAGALTAKKIHLKVAHVEAGLRSFNMSMPEEINRILTDRIADLLFCPSRDALNNLQREGFDHFACAVHEVGDIMKDVAVYYKDRGVKPVFPLPESFVLATLHRAENTDDAGRLKRLVHAFNDISMETPVVLPLHPRTRARLDKLSLPLNKSLIVTEPVGYLEMVYLLTRCGLVITDSGGLQKEAYFFGRHCITVRDQTEWTELVTHGYNTLAGVDYDAIMAARNQFFAREIVSNEGLYGIGRTAERILDTMAGTGGF